MINKKIKLTVPRLKFSAAGILGFIDILCALAIVFGVLSSASAESAIKLWISAVVILLASRIIRLLYFGASSFPQVRFDITLLTTITGLLVLTLVQASSISYASLSNDNNWSVGVLLLSAATLYLLQIVVNNYPQITKLLSGFLALALLLILLGNSPGDMAAMVSRPSRLSLGINLIALSSLFISAYGIAGYKSTLAKAFSFLLLIVALPFAISSIAQGQFVLVFTALALFALMTPKATISRIKTLAGQIGAAMSHKKEIPVKTKVLLTGVGSIALLSMLSFLLKPQFIAQALTGLGQAISRFSTITEVILGMGLTPNSVDAASLLLTYGTLGLFVVSIFLASLFQTMRGISSKGGLLSDPIRLTGIVIVLYSIGIIFTETLSIAARVIMITGMTFVFFQNMPSKSSPFSLNFKFNKIMSSEVWKELFLAIRVLLTITVIVLIPVAIEFVIAIF